MSVVLIVEDETQVLILAESVLQEAGYETISASTVAEALAIVESPDQQIDLLFTDLGLGDENEGGLAVKPSRSLAPGCRCSTPLEGPLRMG